MIVNDISKKIEETFRLSFPPCERVPHQRVY